MRRYQWVVGAVLLAVVIAAGLSLLEPRTRLVEYGPGDCLIGDEPGVDCTPGTIVEEQYWGWESD